MKNDFDLIVIEGGTTGLPAARMAASSGLMTPLSNRVFLQEPVLTMVVRLKRHSNTHRKFMPYQTTPKSLVLNQNQNLISKKRWRGSATGNRQVCFLAFGRHPFGEDEYIEMRGIREE